MFLGCNLLRGIDAKPCWEKLGCSSKMPVDASDAEDAEIRVLKKTVHAVVLS